METSLRKFDLTCTWAMHATQTNQAFPMIQHRLKQWLCSLLSSLILTRRDGLHDLVSFSAVINLQSEKVARGTELELGDWVSLVLLDSDLFRRRQVFVLSAHDLDEFLKVLDFFGLLVETKININLRKGAVSSLMNPLFLGRTLIEHVRCLICYLPL